MWWWILPYEMENESKNEIRFLFIFQNVQNLFWFHYKKLFWKLEDHIWWNTFSSFETNLKNKCNPKSVAFNMKDEKTQKAARTFFSPQILLTVCFPLRELASSMISSCTRLAVWIISAIKAMARWLACTFLVNRKQCFLTEMPPNNLLSNHLVKSGHWI